MTPDDKPVPHQPLKTTAGLKQVTVGFVPLIDAALLIVAREEGFAAAEGIDLLLVREGSWAAIRDKLNVGLFDAAHMLAPAALASTLGVGHLHVPLIAPIALNLDGNAITVSRKLAAELVDRLGEERHDVTPKMTAQQLSQIARERRRNGKPPLTIGVVFGFSCHLYQVREWLKLGGLDPDVDAQFVVIPPPLMVESLSAGLIDAFCAGAPWNRMAEIAGAGFVLHPCARFMPDCAEKLLVLLQNRQDEAWLFGLIRAIGRAAAWTGAAENRSLLARHLARPDYVGAPVAVIEQILSGSAPTLFATAQMEWINLSLEATVPSIERLRLVFEKMRAAGHVGDDAALWSVSSGMMRPDLYTLALGGAVSGR